MNAKIRYGLSAAVLALIAVGAPAPDILDQFLDEKEGNHTTAYRDGSGIWTICRGATMVDGKPVFPGMKLSKEKCDQVNAIERDKALAWVERNIKVPLTEPQKAGIASFCPYNIGPGKCFPSTFYKRLNAGDRKGAEGISLKLYQKPSRKKSVRGVTRKHQTVRLQSPSAMIITLTARLLFRPLFLTV